MSKSQMDNAKSRLPVIKDASQLPNVGMLRKSDANLSGSGVGSGFSSQAFGAFGGFPFSSRSVAQAPNSNKNAYPVEKLILTELIVACQALLALCVRTISLFL